MMGLLPDSAPGRHDAVVRWVGTLLLVLTFVGLAVMSWRKWPDLIADFGADLYIPWRIISGEHLYQGISWKNGPFSQYLNALWFKLFGVSLSSLIFPNLVLIALLTWLIRTIFAKIVSPLAGLTAAFCFLVLFAFAQFIAFGNYSYVCPYRHEQTHGLFFSVVALYCLTRTNEDWPNRWYWLTGITLGIVFLTKIELIVAAAAAVAGGVALTSWMEGTSYRTVAARLAMIFGGGLIPPLIALAGLATRMPFGLALQGTLGNWAYVWRTGVGTQQFFQGVSGFDAPDRNIALMLLQFLVLGGIAIAGIIVEATLRGVARARWVVAAGLVVLVAVAALRWVEWFELPRAFPMIVIFMLAKTVQECLREKEDPQRRFRLIGLATWGMFSMALLGKIILATQITHYGFILSMPATLVILVYLLFAVPVQLRLSSPNAGWFFQATMVGFTIALLVSHTLIARTFYSWKTFSVGSGGDRMVTYARRYSIRGPITAEALKGIEAIVPPDGTLVVLPEGITLNYLARRRSPLPYTIFNPYDLATFGGETVVLDAMKRKKPDYIALVDRDMSEYGVDRFGQDPKFGKITLDWIVTEYRAVRLDGNLPLLGQGFGILLLQRKDLPPPPGVPADK